jgi:dynein heavy chain
MEWFFLTNNNPSFTKPIQNLKDSIIANTLLVYRSISEKFKPTPAKSHYTYNLRDVSKVF